MSIIRRFLSGTPPPRKHNIGTSTYPINPQYFGYDNGLGTIAEDDTVQSKPPAPIATVAAIISIISQTCGQLPRRIYEDGVVSRAPIPNQREKYPHLIGRPNGKDAMSGNTFWEAVFASVEGWGNAYVWIDRIGKGDRGVQGLYFLMPQRVKPFRDGNTVSYRLDDDQNKSYRSDEILHIAKNMYDGVRGMTPIRAGNLSHDLSESAERMGLAFMKRGATVGGIVSSPEKLNQEESDEFYDNFDKFHAGGLNAGAVMLLDGNMKYEKIGIPMNEAQFLETRQFEREEILAWYAPGMPHHLLGWKSSASNWGTGVEAQSIAFVKYVLLSRLRRVEELVSELFLPPELEFEFTVDELMRGDSKVRSEVYNRMRGSGVLSADEWRALEHMAPRGIDDDYWQPLNYDRISKDSGDVLVDSNTPEPIAPEPIDPGMAAEHIVGELRCGNQECPSRADGRKGALLGRNVGAAEIMCNQCSQVTKIKPGEALRDHQDLSEALDVELTRRLT